mgnify:CR=1 FL=1
MVVTVPVYAARRSWTSTANKMSLEPSAARARRDWLALGLAGLFGLPGVARAVASPGLSAAGASFPSKVYQRWAAQYAQLQGVAVDYRPTGSGDGVKRAIARQLPLAGTDAPLQPSELARHRLLQLPTLVGGIVPVVNLPGLTDHPLRLTGPLLADILRGEVDRWDDARIAELNRGLSLPSRRITRVVRSDKSGTTEGLTRYLSAVSPVFRAGPGESAQPAWPGAVEAAAGNDGVAALLRNTPGAITYVSHDRVMADGLSGVVLQNRHGAWVASSEAGFRAAILNSALYREGDDLASLMDRPGADSWPITMTSFWLIDAQPADAAQVEAALRFMWWCFMKGDALTKGTGFAPLPVAVQAKLAARLSTVVPRSGPRPDFQRY